LLLTTTTNAQRKTQQQLLYGVEPSFPMRVHWALHNQHKTAA